MIISLTSFTWYQYSQGPFYRLYLGKYNSQELHHWIHMGQTKWEYTKDPSAEWFFFYNAFHKNPPTSEKIVDWDWTSYGSYTDQVWAYIRLCNRI